MAVNSSYKIYNGSSWEEYYFKTSAGQVGVSSTRKFITTSTTVNGKAFSLASTGDTASVTITGDDIENGVTGTHNYITAGEDINASLVALDIATKSAYDHVPSDVLTQSNYATTLGSVYQGLSTKLTALANNTTNGYVKYGSNTYSVVGNLYATEILMSSGDNTTVASEINTIWQVAEGITKSYAIDGTETGTNVVNGDFNTASGDDITITFTTDPISSYPASVGKLIETTDGRSIYLVNMEIGDNVFITQTDVPDRWLSAKTYVDNGQTWSWTIKFSKLETVKVDLSGYWNSSTHPTTISGYGITDAKIDNGVITLGSNTITPLTSITVTNGGNTATWGSSVTVGTVQGTNLTFTMPSEPAHDTVGNTVSNSNTMYVVGVKGTSGYAVSHVNESVYIGNDNCLYSHSKRVANVNVGSSTPSNNVSGDIWIDTGA